MTVNSSSISDCVELYETRVADVFATGLLFESIDTADESNFSIVNDFTVEADGQTVGSYFRSYWLSAQGVSMPRKSNAITIILPNENAYTITEQHLTISYYNEDTGQELSKTYRMVIESS